MPLQATSGAASYDAFGGGVAAVPQYIEDVFSTYLYTGTGATQNIVNGVDLSTKGGLVWVKSRAGSIDDHILVDTARGTSSGLRSNLTNAASGSGGFTSFNTDGFSFGSSFAIRNDPSTTYVSWTFRKQPKFFDVVTYTGNNGVQNIAHNLGSVPGCIIVKETTGVNNWFVYHKDIGTNAFLLLETTNATISPGQNCWNNTAPTSTQFTVGSTSNTNGTGSTYVAYLFAHDAGGFGTSGTDNVISCGSYTTDGSGFANITLGYEPQWVLIKRTDSTGDWELLDSMRGFTDTGLNRLFANNSGAEEVFAGNYRTPTATGFYVNTFASATFIYIAIRRGPMKVPTDATKVFGITTAAGTSPAYVSSFPVDVALRYQITGGDPTLQARLAGPKKGFTDYDFAESSDANVTWDYQNGMFTSVGANANQYGWLMRRAPSFMDVVCYTNPPSSPVDQTHSHNLGVVPTLVITKGRNQAGGWIVLLDSSILGSVKYLYLNTTAAAASGLTYSATSTQYTTSFIGNYNETQVAYLCATCAGLSNVGSYTGNGTTQTINCGFTGGARFVIIKRTDSTGGWYVYDTDRGMTVLTDPYFFLNDSAAQVATLGSVTTVSTGFALNSAILAAINVSGGTYIFLAIA